MSNVLINAVGTPHSWIQTKPDVCPKLCSLEPRDINLCDFANRSHRGGGGVTCMDLSIATCMIGEGKV